MAKTLTFYDSTNLDDLPRKCRRLFAYIDGPEANYDAAVKRWPHRLIVPITIGDGGPAALRAAIIDCENGDATPETAAEWAQAKLHYGDVPTIYRDASGWPEVTAALAALGLHYGIGTGRVQRMTAEFNGDPAIDDGDVAHQYLGSPGAPGAPGTSPGHYDVTSALAYVPGWGMGHGLTRRHRRYAKALTNAWSHRADGLTGPDRGTVSALIDAGGNLLGRP